jgi:O-antigen ligase
MPERTVLFFVFSLLALCVATGFFSNYPNIVWHTTLKLATILLPLLILTSPEVQRRLMYPQIFDFLPWAMGGAALLLAVELVFNGPIHTLYNGEVGLLAGYNRGFSYNLMLAWPVGAALWVSGRKRQALYFGLALLPALVLTWSRAAQLAVCVGGVVFLAALVAPVLLYRFLQTMTVLFAVWPMGAQAFFTHAPGLVARLPASWHARVEIWDYLSYRILEHPWLGYGIGASHMLSPAEPHGALYVFTQGPAAHPHNFYTELWVELGVPGLVLGVVFALFTLKKAGLMSRPLAPFAMAAWAGCFVLALCAYDFWTDSLFSMFFLLALCFVWAENHTSARSE